MPKHANSKGATSKSQRFCLCLRLDDDINEAIGPLSSFKAIFHCSRGFVCVGEATNFNHVKNQSPGHAKKVECRSTFMTCPRAFERTKNAQDRQLQRKLSNVRSARAGKATAMANGLKAWRTLELSAELSVTRDCWRKQFPPVRGGVLSYFSHACHRHRIFYMFSKRFCWKKH